PGERDEYDGAVAGHSGKRRRLSSRTRGRQQENVDSADRDGHDRRTVWRDRAAAYSAGDFSATCTLSIGDCDIVICREWSGDAICARALVAHAEPYGVGDGVGSGAA